MAETPDRNPNSREFDMAVTPDAADGLPLVAVPPGDERTTVMWGQLVAGLNQLGDFRAT